MIVKSKIEGLDEWLFIEDIPDTFSPGGPLTEKRMAIEREPVYMENQHISCGGMFLMHSEMKFSEPLKIYTAIEGETITSQFVFYYPAGDKKIMPHGASRHNIRFFPSSDASYELKPDVAYFYFLMVISKAYYYRLIDRHSSLHREFVQDVEKGVFAAFSDEDLPITPEMHRIINELREGRKSGELRRLHTETKVLELLICQIEQFNAYQPEGQKILKSANIAKLEKARNILESRFTDPPTQRELAQEVMLNESKLRTGFKEYFSTTIYDYITRLRMETAKSMLIDEGKSIYEAAHYTGFRHQANFSTAFKKYFGISPSDIGS